MLMFEVKDHEYSLLPEENWKLLRSGESDGTGFDNKGSVPGKDR